MADGKVTLEIVTPQGAALREEVDDVTAPSVSGEFGVLPGHFRCSRRCARASSPTTAAAKRRSSRSPMASSKSKRTARCSHRQGGQARRHRCGARSLELKDVDDCSTTTPVSRARPNGKRSWRANLGRGPARALRRSTASHAAPVETFGPPAPPERIEVPSEIDARGPAPAAAPR